MAWFICERWMLGTAATNDSFALLDTAMYQAKKLSKHGATIFVWSWSAKGEREVKAIATAGRCVYVEACHCGRKAGCTYCDSTGWKECG